MLKLLIVDDEKAARFGMKKALTRGNYNITEAENGKQALEIIEKNEIDIVFLDLNMPKMNGMEVIERVQSLSHIPLIIVVTAHGSEKVAVEAMKKGAYDYLSKPYEVDELRFVAQHATEKIELERENKRLQKEIELGESFGEIIGESEAMKNIYDLIDKVANTDITVLIDGESGTGKELVAREIHKRSNRSQKKFVAMNCAALPENLIESELFGHEKGAFTGAIQQRKGKIEEANESTLFLDEIGDMNFNTQAKVLRVLQEKAFERLGGNSNIQSDVRFIAATNKDLEQKIEEGEFREDLYYRIKVLDIHLPPLRDRGNDISLIANRFLELFAKKYKKKMIEITPQAMQKMMEYAWPGNVRQLKNVMEKSVLLAFGDKICIENLPPEILRGSSTEKILSSFSGTYEKNSFKEAKKKFVRDFEKKFIIQRLKEYNGNISQTAQSLEMPRQSLQQKLKELGINAKEIIIE